MSKIRVVKCVVDSLLVLNQCFSKYALSKQLEGALYVTRQVYVLPS